MKCFRYTAPSQRTWVGRNPAPTPQLSLSTIWVSVEPASCDDWRNTSDVACCDAAGSQIPPQPSLQTRCDIKRCATCVASSAVGSWFLLYLHYHRGRKQTSIATSAGSVPSVEDVAQDLRCRFCPTHVSFGGGDPAGDAILGHDEQAIDRPAQGAIRCMSDVWH